MRKVLRVNSSLQCFFLMFRCLFVFGWISPFCHQNTEIWENDCVHSLSSRIQNNKKWVIKSKPQADRSIIHSHFVLMSKHNTTHVNCCDPRNPPKRNIDILFVQRETLYNLHSLMTVHGNTGWRTTSVPHLALIQFSLRTRWTESPSVHLQIHNHRCMLVIQLKRWFSAK